MEIPWCFDVKCSLVLIGYKIHIPLYLHGRPIPKYFKYTMLFPNSAAGSVMLGKQLNNNYRKNPCNMTRLQLYSKNYNKLHVHHGVCCNLLLYS